MYQKIRYRAWLTKEKRMHDVDELIWDKGLLKWVRIGSSLIEIHRVILMATIGIDDKENMPIYDGDILTDQGNQIHIIQWNENEARYNAMFQSSKGDYELARHIIDVKHMTCVGNIYEDSVIMEENKRV
jgi:hypothetical protein